MEGFIGLIIWVVIIIAVSVANKKKQQQKAAGNESSDGTGLGDVLRDLARQMKEGAEETAGKAERAVAGQQRGRGEQTRQTRGQQRRRPMEGKAARPSQRKKSKIEQIEGTKKKAYFEAEEEETEVSIERLGSRPIGGVAPARGERSPAAQFSSSNRQTLRDRIIWSEILGRPVALREKSSNLGD